MSGVEDFQLSQNVCCSYSASISSFLVDNTIMFPTHDWQYQLKYFTVERTVDSFIKSFNQRHVLDTVLHLSWMFFTDDLAQQVDNRFIRDLLFDTTFKEISNGQVVIFEGNSLTDLHRSEGQIKIACDKRDLYYTPIMRAYFWLRCVKEVYYMMVVEYCNALFVVGDEVSFYEFLRLQSIAVILMLHPASLKFWSFVKQSGMTFNTSIDNYHNEILPHIYQLFPDQLLQNAILRHDEIDEDFCNLTHSYLSSISDANHREYWRVRYSSNTIKYNGPITSCSEIYNSFEKKKKIRDANEHARKNGEKNTLRDYSRRTRLRM